MCMDGTVVSKSLWNSVWDKKINLPKSTNLQPQEPIFLPQNISSLDKDQ